MATEQPADFHSMSEYTEVLNAMAAAVESSTAQRDNLREYIGIVEAENAQLHAEIARLKQFIQTNTLGSCTGAASMPVENHGPIESHCSVDTNFESECLDHCEGKDAEHADTATIHVQTHQPNMDLGARRTESKPQRSAGTPHQHSRRGIVDPNESPKPLTLSSLDPPMSHRSNISASKPRRSTQKRSEFSASTDRAETYMVRRLAAQMRQRAVTVDKLYYSMDRFRTDSASFGEFSEGLQVRLVLDEGTCALLTSNGSLHYFYVIPA